MESKVNNVKQSKLKQVRLWKKNDADYQQPVATTGLTDIKMRLRKCSKRLQLTWS